jgi:hypothetical protein
MKRMLAREDLVREDDLAAGLDGHARPARLVPAWAFIAGVEPEPLEADVVLDRRPPPAREVHRGVLPALPLPVDVGLDAVTIQETRSA